MTISVVEAQSRLAELIHQLGPGEELVITENDRTIARLVPERSPGAEDRTPGTLRGTILHVADDFDEPLEDFRDYMM